MGVVFGKEYENIVQTYLGPCIHSVYTSNNQAVLEDKLQTFGIHREPRINTRWKLLHDRTDEFT